MKKTIKKGQAFVSFLFVMTLIVFIFAFVQLDNKYRFFTKDGLEKKLGDLQFELIDKYAQGEDYLFYMDQAVKYSLDLAIFNLAEHGGYFDALGLYEYEVDISAKSECGEYNGYQIWKTETKDCYPEKYKDNLNSYFSLFFSAYLSQYDLDDPYFDVNIFYVDNVLEILGSKAAKSLIIYREGQKPTGKLTADSAEHNAIIEAGIKALKSIGKNIVPITGSAVSSYTNPGEYINFENVQGPYYVHIDRKNRIMVIINNNKEIAAAAPINVGLGGKGYPVLVEGNIRGSYTTPTGTYKLRKESTIPGGDIAAFGSNGVWRVLEPYSRGVLIHTGRNSNVNLVPTYGCIRIADRMMIAMNEHLNPTSIITIT